MADTIQKPSQSVSIPLRFINTEFLPAEIIEKLNFPNRSVLVKPNGENLPEFFTVDLLPLAKRDKITVSDLAPQGVRIDMLPNTVLATSADVVFAKEEKEKKKEEEEGNHGPHRQAPQNNEDKKKKPTQKKPDTPQQNKSTSDHRLRSEKMAQLLSRGGSISKPIPANSYINSTRSANSKPMNNQHYVQRKAFNLKPTAVLSADAFQSTAFPIEQFRPPSPTKQRNLKLKPGGKSKALRVARGVLKAAANYEFVIVFLCVFLLATTFLMVFGGFGGAAPNVTATDEGTGEQVTNPEAGGETLPPVTTTPPGQVPTLEEFLTIYDVKSCTSLGQRTFTGCGNASATQINFLYKTLSIPLASPTYRQLLTAKGKITIYLRPSPDPSCSGCTSGGADYGGSIIQYWGYVEAGDTRVIRVSMVHETGHIIRQRNPSLNNMPLADLARQDSACYTFAPAKNGQPAGYYINTYANKNNGLGGGPLSETQAELMGMNVYAGPGVRYSKGLAASIPITDYPSKCPASYSWIKTNIYGGVDFFGLDQPTTPIQNPQ